MRLRSALVPIFVLLYGGIARPQTGAEANRYDLKEVMIPMRDGVRLHTKILVPKDRPPEPLPFIMDRTPYGIAGSQNALDEYLKALSDDGYIFVFQDIRGRFTSEGTFVMLRPARASGDPKGLDEGTDTYDTIEWLLKNVPGNNGRVGILGISYDGWTTMMGALEPHPALKAISPQASPADMWLGDDFHHNGAFRLSYGFEYAAGMEASKEVEPFGFDRYDTYEWYLALGALSNVNEKYLHGKIPTWNDYVAHPDYDEFWKRQTMIPYLTKVAVPTLNVGGWWDQEDFYGPLRIYEAYEAHDDVDRNHLVVGPWNHGGWAGGDGDALGKIHFGSATGKYFREEVQAPFFSFWLKDEGKLDLPEALTFESGSNRWRSWDEWPPTKDTVERSLYFHAGGRLSFDAPTADGQPDAHDSYLSDPKHPVPYRQRPIEGTYFPHGSRWSTWLVEDQRFVDDRADVLSWETEPLAEDVTIAGEVLAKLFVSTTGTDADYIVKLIDVYPEEYPTEWELSGFQLMVSNEVFRARYRNSFERPEPMTAGEITAISFSLHTQSYSFLKGHRIMVQVQSTWFPLIDRNPQKYVSNIFKATDDDFQEATQRVYRSTAHPSRVVVPVVRTGSR
jgi:putative CocE/NonD family hydrolase